MLVLLECLGSLLGLWSHLLLRSSKEELVGVVRLRNHLRMVVLTYLYAIRGGKGRLKGARRLQKLLLGQPLLAAGRLGCLWTLWIALMLQHACFSLPL